VQFVQVSNMKIINDLLNIHKFIVISVVSIEIIVIVISFDSILKSSSISTKIQYQRKFNILLISHSSLSFITIESKSSFFWSDKKSSTTERSRSEWNTLWTCINFNNFSLYEELMRSKLMKELSILSFNFLKNLAVMMFLSFRNIFDSIS